MQGSDSVHRLSRRRLGTPSGSVGWGFSAKPATDLICANKRLTQVQRRLAAGPHLGAEAAPPVHVTHVHKHGLINF
jgi:hypothetical protein